MSGEAVAALGVAVYVIGDEAGRHKIGVSATPERRRAHLQTERKTKLTLVATYQSPTGRGWAIESKAHALLSDCRLSGEWFAVTADQAMETVQRALEMVEATPPTGLGQWTIKVMPKSVRDMTGSRQE